jgi:hypothetical protein
VGKCFHFKKVKSLKVIYMATVSYGAVYRTPFTGTAVIGGAMYDWKVSKRLDIKLTDLLVYAPYVSYYNDVVMKSPYVMLPSIGINVGITKKFKFNINAGGAWDLKTAALNYTVTCGTRILVGTIILFMICLLYSLTSAQTFTYSGYIKNADGTGAVNVPVKLYKRTTPVMTGFTSQNNFNGHSYYRSTGSMTWTAAKQACINMGGHLVTSTTLAENNFLFGLWPSGWIGLTDEVTEGVWKWVTGETYSWSYWNSGEPNNAGNEDYIQFVGGGRWNDLPNTSLPYVLEFEYIVTYTAWAVPTNCLYKFIRNTIHFHNQQVLRLNGIFK